MPSKKKKYNSRFPPARIKKIMQSDDEVGKVAQVVPIIISKALEIFVASLLRSSSAVTRSRNARTLTPNHIKTSILSDDQFQFLRELAQTIPDVNPGAEAEEEEGSAVGMTTTAGTGSTGSAPQMAPSVPRFQRKTSENRTTTTATVTSTTSGHQLSASGQVAATGFRTRGRPRKRPLEPQMSAQLSRTISAASSTATTIEEPEEDEETEEESEDEEVDDEEDCQPLNSNNNVNRISSSQQIISNNNKNSFNYYYSSNTTTHPSIATIESTSQSLPSVSAAARQSMTASMVLKHQKPAIDEDDDYDN